MYPLLWWVHLFFVILLATIEESNMTDTKFQIVLKSNEDKNKQALLYLMYTWDKRYKMSLGVSVLPKWWDKEKECAIISSQQKQQEQRNLKKLNKFLEQVKERVRATFFTYRYHPKKDSWCEMAGNDIKHAIKERIAQIKKGEVEEEEKLILSPLQYFKKIVEEMPKKIVRRTSKIIEQKTVGHHEIVLKRFESFLNYKHWVASSFSMFDKHFESQMEQWMLGVVGYSANTVAATFSVMKVWLKQAEEEGLITDKSFHGWKSKGTDVQHIYLNEEELKAIYELNFDEIVRLHPNAKYEETRDIFLIAAYIGLRYGDFSSLNRANWDIENRTIQVHTHKTGATVKVPLSSVVIELYHKYNGHFPQPREKGKFNTQLQKIGELAGINQTIFVKKNIGGKIIVEEKKKYQLISSHTARRSFATNLYLKSKNARLVMNFTGHTTEENFRKYICVDKNEYIDMAREYFD